MVRIRLSSSAFLLFGTRVLRMRGRIQRNVLRQWRVVVLPQNSKSTSQQKYYRSNKWHPQNRPRYTESFSLMRMTPIKVGMHRHGKGKDHIVHIAATRWYRLLWFFQMWLRITGCTSHWSFAAYWLRQRHLPFSSFCKQSLLDTVHTIVLYIHVVYFWQKNIKNVFMDFFLASIIMSTKQWRIQGEGSRGTSSYHIRPSAVILLAFRAYYLCSRFHCCWFTANCHSAIKDWWKPEISTTSKVVPKRKMDTNKPQPPLVIHQLMRPALLNKHQFMIFLTKYTNECT